MTHLENIFLKNVVLYLETLKDITNFILINKSCFSVIQTMYTNTYNLSLHSSIDDILFFFPKLETLYFRAVSTRLRKMSSNDIPLIEVNAKQISSKFSQTLKTKWFPPKVRKMRILWNEIDSVAKNKDNFEQLQFLFIDYTMTAKEENSLFEVLQIKTLRKVYIIFTTTTLQTINKFNFSERKEVEFTLVVLFSSYTYEVVEVDALKKMPNNVKVFANFLSKETNSLEFLPALSCILNNYTINQDDKNKSITVTSDVSGKEDLIYEKMEKGLLTTLDIMDPKTLPKWDVTLNAYIQPNQTEKLQATFNFQNQINFDFIEAVNILNVDAKDLVLPRLLKKISIIDCTGKINMKNCRAESITLRNFVGESLEFSDEKLTSFKCDNSIGRILFKHNGVIYEGKFVANFSKYINFSIANGFITCDILIEKDGKIVDKIVCTRCWYTNTETINSFRVENFTNGFDLSNEKIDQIQLVMNPTQNSFSKNLKFGNLKKINITAGNIKTVELGVVGTITVVSCKIENLIIKSAKTFTYKNSVFENVKAEKINKINGTKKNIINLKIEK
ncbi:hypothetical protein EIN_265120 [Entamoeba invadens IP1]|uniref:Uncharacterized protein n=1 Tax=Entamoeba invadens IP1 TaxID=370355 RepID=A0A0A1TZT4_ENTIV|nr:hypothetical protein EIN_265120 [Entamoeba invadens IP1]ELP85705.1 hypothetical protein EIN_265120 [Entamoeba invadens IP1]|eukprot:XP_004185051.1 hypothetical protein EIN_265120 [Entamoeba invadens IP1]